ncbi:alpha/beta fold hydrolase [Fulvivirgaceae bacterium PWU4]|uniref:Alpha/beta fold hydrolase n=1 Tax=Chryseosolibacter histidini TaxID=2782349 RepID=A0AAP2DIV3_9BACT|nr:alpha/beta fold hydrolase [Chryseosolibacter histidini]MBT1697121.1 alpha/beta fold hydrolase [Chryseosolibacter histidini]
MKSIYFLPLFLLTMTNDAFSQSGKTYILVHGAWHGAWCWDKVIPLVQARGHKAIAVDLPGHGHDTGRTSDISLDDYVNEVVKTVNAQNGQVILVGHSMSGIVISQAAEKLGRKKISALVYLDAFLPRDGESLFALVDATLKNLTPNSRKPMLVENLIVSEDHKTNSVNPAMVAEIFYHDCAEEDKEFALPRISKEPIAPLATPLHLTDDVYGMIPKYYILCTESRDMDKTFLSTHVPCKKVYKLASSHSPFFSMPEKLVDILNEVK